MTNPNVPDVRGSAPARRASRRRMLVRYAADVDLVSRVEFDDLFKAVYDDFPALWQDEAMLWVDTIGVPHGMIAVHKGLGRPAARCYRCGVLCTFETAERDRVRPGARGGQYVDENIRPCCSSCNTITGNELKAELAKERAEAAARKRARRERERARRIAAMSAESETMTG